MNFYEHQQQARKQTVRLLFLFGLAIVLLSVLMSLAFAIFGYSFGLYNARFASLESGASIWQIALTAFHWKYLGTFGVTVLAIVVMAAWFRTYQLSAGGRVVAEQLGGQLLNINAHSLEEKMALNVVEEMAIASGVPVPPVYLIEEQGINAFAAGYKPSDAVIGITRGAIESLSRDELQGVIAHEFSHILNGDMRLNLRLIGLIYGITVLASTGRHFVGGGRHSRRGQSTLSIGLVLIILGYLGVFFANLIKAAVSRQREYLADASAVQFTRNNWGIANALKKIGGLPAGSHLRNADSAEISHMLFAQGVSFSFVNSWMATHPPLEKRIARIEPSWDGSYITPTAKVQDDVSNDGEPVSSVAEEANHLSLVDAIDHSGELTAAAIAEGASRVQLLNVGFPLLNEWAHEPYGSRALVLGLILDEREAYRQQQLAILAKSETASFVDQAHSAFVSFGGLDAIQRLALLDIALPVLKQLSEGQFQSFKKTMMNLIMVDKKIELKEWSMFNLVNYYCRAEDQIRLTSLQLEQRKPAVAMLLSAVVAETLEELDGVQLINAKARFEQISTAEFGFSLRWYAPEEISLRGLSQSLAQLRQLEALQKPRLLKAFVRAAEMDGDISRTELELIYCIAQALDCPLVLPR